MQRRALQAPVQVCERATLVLGQTPALAKAAGRSLASDVTAGSARLIGGFAAAAPTVAANLEGLGHSPQAAAVRRRLRQLLRSLSSYATHR